MWPFKKQIKKLREEFLKESEKHLIDFILDAKKELDKYEEVKKHLHSYEEDKICKAQFKAREKEIRAEKARRIKEFEDKVMKFNSRYEIPSL